MMADCVMCNSCFPFHRGCLMLCYVLVQTAARSPGVTLITFTTGRGPGLRLRLGTPHRLFQPCWPFRASGSATSARQRRTEP